MSIIVVEGGNRLEGKIKVQGSKNSLLPLLAATVSAAGTSVIHNCPRLTDIEAAIRILTYLGCCVVRQEDTVIVDSTNVDRCDIPDELMHEMRSSIIFLGPLIARFGRASLSTPGGCEIGSRPIDLHTASLRLLGAQIDEDGGHLECRCPRRLRGVKVDLSFPSVGATENIMIAAATAKGTTTITNAAREPEISDLACYLNASGARIRGAGEGTITIDGTDSLSGCEHTVIPDRIVADTYMTAAAVTGGNIYLENIVPAHLSPMLFVFRESGCRIRLGGNTLWLKAPRRLERIRFIQTMPYPGFPTDAQANAMAMACIAKGRSVIVENIFESRFRHVDEFLKLGARITVEGRKAVVEGVPRLYGADVVTPDLRGGAALVAAGLAAEGVTKIRNVKLIDRGCESFEENLRLLGASVKREEFNESGNSTQSKLPAGAAGFRAEAVCR